MKLSIQDGLMYIGMNRDEKLQDEIIFLGAHGIDVNEPSKAGTTLYRDFITRQRNKRFDKMSTGIEEKKKNKKVEKSIDNELQRLKNGRKNKS